MALDRQMDLTMDAMQASQDAMLGKMAQVREALMYPKLGYGDEPPKETKAPLKPRPSDDEPMPKPKPPTGEGIHSETKPMQVAGDVVPIERKEPIKLWNVEKPAGYEGADPSAVASAHMRGSLKVLRPTPGGEEKK